MRWQELFSVLRSFLLWQLETSLRLKSEKSFLALVEGRCGSKRGFNTESLLLPQHSWGFSRVAPLAPPDGKVLRHQLVRWEEELWQGPEGRRKLHRSFLSLTSTIIATTQNWCSCFMVCQSFAKTHEPLSGCLWKRLSLVTLTEINKQKKNLSTYFYGHHEEIPLRWQKTKYCH